MSSTPYTRPAIICPIGDLNRFGYNRHAQMCLESWQQVGDLFLVHSSRADMPFEIDAQYIRNEQTLLPIVNGGERFDHRIVAQNANYGIQAAKAQGYGGGITICVNWYVEKVAANKILDTYHAMHRTGAAYEFLYRRQQFGSVLFDADMRSIAVLNFAALSDNPVIVLVDSIIADGKIITGERGDFSKQNAQAYIDIGLEVTETELQEKLIDIRNYEDLVPKRSGASFEFWKGYYKNRLPKMKRSTGKPGKLGKVVIEKHQADFISEWLLCQ